DRFLGGGPLLPCGIDGVSFERGGFRQKLPCRDRYKPAGQTRDDGRFRFQPKSHVCRVHTHLARPVPHLLKSDSPGLYGGRGVAYSPASAAGRGLLAKTLRTGLFRVLRPGPKVSLGWRGRKSSARKKYAPLRANTPLQGIVVRLHKEVELVATSILCTD